MIALQREKTTTVPIEKAPSKLATLIAELEQRRLAHVHEVEIIDALLAELRGERKAPCPGQPGSVDEGPSGWASSTAA
jgi:hypothetical protein